MTQHDMNVANQLFPATRADLNNAFLALASLSSGATAPSSPVAYQLWADTTTGILKIRTAANDAWVALFEMATGEPQAPVEVQAVPIGTIIGWSGTDAPARWTWCAGQVLRRATYPGLFNILGTRYNTGGETAAQFRVPDLRGRAIVGRDNMNGTTAGRVTQAGSGLDGVTLGSTGGHQLLHAHTHTASASTDGGHQHNYTYNVPTGTSYASVNGTNAGHTDVTGTVVAGGDHTHTITVTSSGSGTGQNIQPSMVLNFIIYTGEVGATDDDSTPANADPTLGALEAMTLAFSDESTALTTGVKLTFRWPFDSVFSEAVLPRLSLNTATASGVFQVDVLADGVSIFTTELTCDATEKTSTTAATPCVLLAEGIDDDVEVDVEIITTDGTAAGGKITFYHHRVIA